MNRHIAAWGIAAVGTAAYLGVGVVDPSDASVLLWVPVVVLFLSVGAVLWTRVPANPIGPLFVLAGMSFVLGAIAGAYGDLGAHQVPTWPAAGLATSVSNLGFFYAIGISLIGIPLIFPDGRLPSRRFRIVVAILVVDLVAWTVGVVVGEGAGDVVNLTVLVSTIVGFAGAATAVTLRFRRGGPIQRQQVKWLAANAAMAAICFPVALLMPDPAQAAVPAFAAAVWVAAILTLLFLPVVIAIAVLRYRLYDIDRIVSRTVSYALVTGILAAVFAAVVLLLSSVLARFGQSDSIAVAASTLAVFAIFQPVLRRVRHRVDRRFNRARYDAERTASSFSTRLRDEVDIGTVAADLRDTVEGAVKPSALALWIRGRATITPGTVVTTSRPERLP
jgi:hypothetical protein